jgi:hypothetical protein
MYKTIRKVKRDKNINYIDLVGVWLDMNMDKSGFVEYKGQKNN